MIIIDERQFMKRTNTIHRHQRERAAKDFQAVPYTLAELRQKARAAVTCCYCGVCLTTENFSLDHRRPIACGGKWTLENLTVIDRRCNEIKSNMDHEEFSRFMLFLGTLSLAAREGVTRRLRAGAVRIYARKGKAR